MRVNAWVSGGGLPDAVKGTKLEGLSTIWDWCVDVGRARPMPAETVDYFVPGIN